MKSILTKEERAGFVKDQGIKLLYSAGLFLGLAAAYYFWAGPWFRDSPPERINAIFYVFYSALGVGGGGVFLCGIAGLFMFGALRKFAKSRLIRESDVEVE